MAQLWQRSTAFMIMISLCRSTSLLVRSLQPTARRRAFANGAWSTFARPIQSADDNLITDEPVVPAVRPMSNLYRSWTLEQDRELYQGSKTMGVSELAARLGRGLRGVETRLQKLKDVDSSAYQRLFTVNPSSTREEETSDTIATKEKLVPVIEVIRRIKWSPLDSSGFFILHFDRVEDCLVESPFTAPNDSIPGKETMLIDAIPEHRIMAVKYRERVVWDRTLRVDLVFGSGGIEHMIDTYRDWKQQQEGAESSARQQQQQVMDTLQSILGSERFHKLQELSTSLVARSADPSVSTKLECEKFTESALSLFRLARDDTRKDSDDLDLLSEFVALLPDEGLRRLALLEISLHLTRATGDELVLPSIYQLPELKEEDITETFIRGSGPGGQKINKTSNRVLLIHKPTNLRVECQDTRSLQQNRKLARKRLRLKLDEHLNGSQSLESTKATKASTKKAKAKARSRKRQRQRQEANESDSSDDPLDQTEHHA